jgi:threonine synthase
MSIWRWNEWLPPISVDAQVTLGEGDTPLVRSRKVGPAAGLDNLFFKLETVNPTGSYKDRFAASAVSHMLATGQTRCIATSSGNTGSALAAYCAATEIRCNIAIVETAPLGKLQQMLAYGARLYRVRGFGLDASITQRTFDSLQRTSISSEAPLQISAFHYSPLGMSGVQTISYELVEQLPGGVQHVFSPSGGGGLTLAVARGFEQMVSRDRIPVMPRVHCVQPEGNNTIAGPLREGRDRAVDVACTTQISGVQVANVIDGHETLAACRRSGGTGHVLTDTEVWSAQARLAREEGIFCEPAGAIAFAGALRARAVGELDAGATVVCLITGSGFKDPPSVARMVEGMDCPMLEVNDLRTYMGLQ